MAATDAEIRAWARLEGIEVTARGAVPSELREQHAQAHANLGDGLAAELGGELGGDQAANVHQITEKRPRSVPVQSSWQRWRKGRKRTGKARAKRPRVPVDDVIGGIYRAVASFLTPLPATSRMMKFQAPAAGMVLEDAVNGTIVDRVLQPVARSAAGFEVFSAVVLPPLLVAALEIRGPAVAPFVMPMLRDLMLRYAKLAGPKMAEAMAREQEFEAEFGVTVDQLLEQMFMPPSVEVDEEDLVARMQATVAS